MLKVGDWVRRIPVTFCTHAGEDGVSGPVVRSLQAGRVVYIHPEGRYHVVEFDTPGGHIREAFKGVMA